MVLVRVRRTIKPEDFVFFTFLMESPEIWGEKTYSGKPPFREGPWPYGPIGPWPYGPIGPYRALWGSSHFDKGRCEFTDGTTYEGQWTF